MTRTGGIRIAFAGALCAAFSAGAALAQGGPPGEGGEEPAPPPAEPVVLGVGFGPDLEQMLDGEGATLEELLDGMVFSYDGEEPLRSYLVAARFDDDRLVRYDVSEPFMLDPGAGNRPEDEDVVIRHAFGPRTEQGVALSAIEAVISPPDANLVEESFVGSMPANTLMEMIRPDLTEPLETEVRDGLNSIGVLALIPTDDARRTAPGSRITGAVLRLNYQD